MSNRRNRNWCTICHAYCGTKIHRHSCYTKVDKTARKKIINLNFQMRDELHRHLFIDPASDSFPQMDVFSRDQVLTLLTELGHKVVPCGRSFVAPYWLSGGPFSVAAGGRSSASVGSRPPSAALGAPPSVAAGVPPPGGSSGSAPSVSSYVSAPSGSSVAAVGAPPSGGPSGDSDALTSRSSSAPSCSSSLVVPSEPVASSSSSGSVAIASGSGTARLVAPPRRSFSSERSSEIDTDDDSHLEVSDTRLQSLYHGSIDGVSPEDSLKTTRRATVRPPIVECGDSSDMDDDTADPDFEPSKQRSPSSYASKLRKTRVVRKVERGIDSDEEGAVLPPTTTTHRYNYAVDKVKAFANTKGLYDTAPFDRLPIFRRYREFLTDDLVKSKKNSDMIVSKAKTIMWFVNGNAEKVHPECNLILLNKTAIGNFKRHLETLNFANSTIRIYLQSTFTFMNWLKNWDETEGKIQLEHYTNAMSYLSMMIKGVSKKARQDTRREKCTDIGRTAPPTPWEVNAVLRSAYPRVSIIVDRCVAAGSVSSEDLSMVNAFFCAEICIHHAQRPSMVENLRKAEFDAAQPVRNQETGKVDYIVRVADHKTAEVAPGVITLEPHIHQLLCKYIIIRQHVLDSVNPLPRPASLLVNSKGGAFTNVTEAVARLHRRCGITTAFTNRDARRSYETWSQNLPQREDLAWYIAHSTDVAKRHYTASKTCSTIINAMIQHSKGKSRLVDIPESMPGVDEVSCVRRRVVPLPSPSVSASDTSRSDTPTYVGDALGTPSTSVTLGASSAALGAPPSGGPSTSATFGSPPASPILTPCYVSLCASPPAESCRPGLSPGHLPHSDGFLRSPPPTAPRSPTPPPPVVSPTTVRARRKEQVYSQLLSELTPFTDMTVVPSIIDLQRRFPGLGKVWATSVHEKLRYARRKSFHEQIADDIIRTVVKRRKGSLLDLDESELADICPDSATLNSRYGGRYRVQDILVRRIMPHRLARLQQEVSGYLDLHDEQQILERITSQDWPGLAMIPTLDMGRGVMATRFFRSGSVVCDYHGPVLKRDQAESLRRSMAAAESNYMYFFKYDSQRLCIDAVTVPCVCHPRIPTVWADGEPFRVPSEPTHGL